MQDQPLSREATLGFGLFQPSGSHFLESRIIQFDVQRTRQTSLNQSPNFCAASGAQLSFLLHDCSQATAGRRFTHQLVDLGEGRVLDVQPVGGDAIQSRVVQHHLTCKKTTHTHGRTKGRYWRNKEGNKKTQRGRVSLQQNKTVEINKQPQCFREERRGYRGNDAVKEPLWEPHSAPLFGEKTRNIKDTLYGCNGAGGSRGRFY